MLVPEKFTKKSFESFFNDLKKIDVTQQKDVLTELQTKLNSTGDYYQNSHKILFPFLEQEIEYLTRMSIKDNQLVSYNVIVDNNSDEPYLDVINSYHIGMEVEKENRKEIVFNKDERTKVLKGIIVDNSDGVKVTYSYNNQNEDRLSEVKKGVLKNITFKETSAGKCLKDKCLKEYPDFLKEETMITATIIKGIYLLNCVDKDNTTIKSKIIITKDEFDTCLKFGKNKEIDIGVKK